MSQPKRATRVFGSFRTRPQYRRASAELEPNLTLANNVLQLRFERELSQAELAERAGMSQPRIADIEGAKGNPSLGTISRVATALGVSMSRLLVEAPLSLPVAKFAELM